MAVRPEAHAESEAYRESLKVYWDLNNSFDTAREEGWEKGHEAGRIEGIEEGKRGIALKLLNQGVAPDVIAQASGLSLEELERLKSNEPPVQNSGCAYNYRADFEAVFAQCRCRGAGPTDRSRPGNRDSRQEPSAPGWRRRRWAPRFACARVYVGT